MTCLFFYYHDDEFPSETSEISDKQSMPQSKEHQRQEMWQILVAKETKAFEDVPTGIQYKRHVNFNTFFALIFNAISCVYNNGLNFWMFISDEYMQKI